MTIALIVAAGSGERLGADRPKALVELGGRPMLQWSLDALGGMAEIEQIVVALPAGAPAPRMPDGVLGVPGGATRSDSVRRALQASGDGDMVLVHDAARPLLTGAMARAVIAALERDPAVDAAIAASPVADTIKRADRELTVSETLAREELWAVQTPQVFRRAALERALEVSADVLAQATDDAWLIERAGGGVKIVPVAGVNLKVTTPFDLHIAGELLAQRSAEPSPAAPPGPASESASDAA